MREVVVKVACSTIGATLVLLGAPVAQADNATFVAGPVLSGSSSQTMY